jgi:hypothetical protein
MKVQLPGMNALLRKNKAEKQNLENSKVSTPDIKDSKLSFMSIPSVAFAGKLVVPNLPKGLNADPEAKIHLEKTKPLQELEKQPVVNYKVYPQDPLVSKPEVYKLKGEVAPGPESARVKTVDKSEVAKPDAKGNYLYDEKTPQFDRVNAYLFASKTLKLYEDALGRKIDWAFPNDQIKIHPRAGVTMNAYYSRWDQEIKLFYFQNKFDPKETCYTSKMADVVTHEAGHAVLDGLRPSYIGWGSHGGAIHEGFGDSTAMLVCMQNEKLLDDVIKRTGGDLKKENWIASLAEQFGKAVYGNKMYLRNAINDLKMSDFETGRESKEVHNFGRLFGAFFYDLICEATAQNAKSMPLKDALMKTREDLTKLFARAMGDFSPPGNVYFDDIAKAMLQAEKTDLKGEYKEVLQNVLKSREILKAKEITNWEQSQKQVPSMQLPSAMLDSKSTIETFVNQNKAKLNLPADNKYSLESAYTNDFGETFVQLKAPKEVSLPFGTEQFALHLYDGATLGFDKAGKLFYVGENKTTSMEVQDAVEDAMKHLNKMQDMQDKGMTIGQPTVYKMPGSSNVIVKVPKIEDPVNG